MDVARLQLTIDGKPSLDTVAALDAELKKLPASAQAAAAQVTAALNSIRTAATALGTVQVNVNAATQQGSTAAVNYSSALQQIVMQLSQVNAQLNASVNSTNQLNTAFGQFASQTRSVGTGSAQAAAATGNLNVNLASVLRTVGTLVGIQFGAVALREFVVGSVEADISMQRMRLTMEAVSGSAATASNTLAFLHDEANRIGIGFIQAGTAFSRFSAATKDTAISAGQTRQIFTDLSEASARLHLRADETARVFLAFEQMASKGVVSMEELRRQLGNVIPGAFSLAAKAAGVTTEEFNKMVKEGKVLAEDLLPKLAEEIRKAFPLGDAATATVAELNRVKNAWFELKAAFGEAARPATNALARESATSMERLRMMLFPKGDEQEIQRAAMLMNMKRLAMLPAVLAGYNPAEFDENFPELERLRTQTLRLDAQRAARRGEGPTAPREQREDASDVERAKRMLLEYQAQEYEGYNRKVLLAEIAYNREVEQINKLTINDARRAELRAKAEEGYDAIKARLSFEEGTRERKEFDRIEEERQKRIAATEREVERVRELFARIESETGGGGKDADVSKVNFRYAERLRQLQEIALVEDASSTRTDEIAQKLDQWRTRELAQIEAKYARHFIGEGSVLELLNRRKQLELELLTIHQDDPEGAKRSQEIQREMRDLNQTIALQFQTGGVKSGEAFLFGLQQARDQWGNEAQRMATIGQGVAQSLESGFTNAFTSMLLGQKSVAAGFHDMANSIISDIARIIVQQSISVPIANAVLGVFAGGFGGSLGTTLPATGGAYAPTTAGLAHGGGVVGYGDTRTTTMAAFAFAPRYHGGGVVGDEMPIVARKGEVVFTPEQMTALGKAIGNGGQKQQTKVEVVNVFDESDVDRRIAANPNIVLNVISRNATMVRRMLA